MIGGSLDLDALRLLHRPRTAQAMRAAVAEMTARGMRAAEIATATGMHIDEVRRLLSLQAGGGGRACRVGSDFRQPGC